MTQDEMEAIVMAFPGAEKGISYGRPSYKLNGKFFTRLRREDDRMVIMDVSFDEREMLMEAEPGTFHFTAHYKDYPYVCLLYTSDAADERSSVDLGGRRIIKKKKR